MDDVVAQQARSLYEADFYAWTQEQSVLLRDGDLSKIDVENILEEIETLGRQEVSELWSRLTVLAQHLLKEMYRPEMVTRDCAVTIITQRREIAWLLSDSPSLEPRLTQTFAEAYADAHKVAAAETGLPEKAFPVEPPFSYAQAMDESFWPGRPVADRG